MRIPYDQILMKVRDAQGSDFSFLADILAVAADWRPDSVVRSGEEVLRVPAFAHYLEGWPQRGDCGVVAETTEPVGAAWFRLLTSTDHGYGYVADDVPEITIGVLARYRGHGVGTAVLRRLIDRAREDGHRALSLSVEDDNPAARMYRRAGFVPAEHREGAWTMILDLTM
jgi:ribosomal protein S18 acetylase RimI-like enzyme